MRLPSFLFSKSEQPLTLLRHTTAADVPAIADAFRRMNAEAMAMTDKQVAREQNQMRRVRKS